MQGDAVVRRQPWRREVVWGRSRRRTARARSLPERRPGNPAPTGLHAFVAAPRKAAHIGISTVLQL